MKENIQEVHKFVHPKHFRVSGIKISNVSDKGNFSNIAADTVALTETQLNLVSL